MTNFISNRIKRRFLQPGDHIYTWRRGFLYSHHGVYRGENQVVHFTSLASASSVPRTRATCAACELFEHSDRNSGVIVSCLDCFIGHGSLYRYQYGVSSLGYSARRPGTSNTAESGPVEVVMARALSLLAENGFGEYDLVNNNCEDFATFCKTGQKCDRNGTSVRYGQASVLRRLGLRTRADRL